MIPDEAVEAAARSLYRGQPIYDEAAGVTTGHKPWEWTEPEYQEAMIAEARTALKAALLFLSDAARQPQRNSPTDWPDIPKARS